MSYEEAVEEALCVGWVDSTGRNLDDERSIQWFSPRRPRSAWARSNKERVARLTAAGLMLPAGLGVIEDAKRNGMWTLLDDVENLIVPDDLAAALAGEPNGRANWDAFPPSARRAMLQWVVEASRAGDARGSCRPDRGRCRTQRAGVPAFLGLAPLVPAVHRAEHPFAAGHRGDPRRLVDQLDTSLGIDLVDVDERQPADLPGDALALQESVWIGHRPAMLEAQVDVVVLRCDVGEVDALLADRQVVADQAPAGPDAFHRVGDGGLDDLAESMRDGLHRGREVVEQRLGRDAFHTGHHRRYPGVIVRRVVAELAVLVLVAAAWPGTALACSPSRLWGEWVGPDRPGSANLDV